MLRDMTSVPIRLIGHLLTNPRALCAQDGRDGQSTRLTTNHQKSCGTWGVKHLYSLAAL